MLDRIVNLIFEALFLKEIKHEGRRRVGVQFPDSVAEHSLNAAQIGYILAKMEWADVAKVVQMLIWHDIAEARIGDVDKVNARYIRDKHTAEDEALHAQMAWIEFGWEIIELLAEMEKKETLEAKIAKDADYLEVAFQGKKYMEIWYTTAQNHITNVRNALRTESWKQIFDQMCNTKSTDRRDKSLLQDLSNV